MSEHSGLICGQIVKSRQRFVVYDTVDSLVSEHGKLTDARQAAAEQLQKGGCGYVLVYEWRPSDGCWVRK